MFVCSVLIHRFTPKRNWSELHVIDSNWHSECTSNATYRMASKYNPKCIISEPQRPYTNRNLSKFNAIPIQVQSAHNHYSRHKLKTARPWITDGSTSLPKIFSVIWSGQIRSKRLIVFRYEMWTAFTRRQCFPIAVWMQLIEFHMEHYFFRTRFVGHIVCWFTVSLVLATVCYVCVFVWSQNNFESNGKTCVVCC